MKYRVGVISLGCPKNQVDCEIMIKKLEDADFEITENVEDSDIVLVNTCGFIEDAKKEAIDNILYACELKQQSDVKAVVVTGCLAQRYKEDVLKEIPEVDAVLGIGANDDIVSVCKKALEGEGTEVFPPVCNMPMNGGRTLTTPPYTAYLRIADGCSNRCSYCAIPLIRGDFRSRDMEDVLSEAESLVQSGVKEIVVIAQDTTRYGLDNYKKLMLPELLHRMAAIENLEWIRLLYCYPDCITDELLEVMNSEAKICNYIDLPLQHADKNILSAMNRRGDSESLLKLIEKIRSHVEDVVIRTTLITGFPGEGEEEFECLANFVKQAQFDRLGCFTYSPEEGTPAAEMQEQVEENVKQERMDIIMRSQHDIACRKNEEKIDRVYKVLVEGYDGYTDSYYGRSYMDAYEIDTQVLFTSAVELFNGEFVNVRIINTDEYDLIGEAVELL